MAQLYPDEHAQALAELRSCSWHVPEHTIAQLIGFDGDVQNLRAWVRKLKMRGMDIAAFNAYEDKTGGGRERWWIIGHLTPKDAGILTTVVEQRTITNILASEATALRYGINDLMLREMQEEARKWTHHEERARSDSRRQSTYRRAPSAGHGDTVPTVAGLAAAAKAERDGTDNQNDEAASKMLVRWLTVFHIVHGLSTVKELEDVFFNPATKKLRIKGEKTVERLITEVARCSMYLNLNDSPNGFDPLAATRSMASASGESSVDDVGGSEDEGGDGFDAERPERVQ